MSELRPRDERLASRPAQHIDGDELRFTSAEGWQRPQAAGNDAAVADASPRSAMWPYSHGADDHGADDHGADDHGADDHGADDHGADDQSAADWGDDGRDDDDWDSHERNADAYADPDRNADDWGDDVGHTADGGADGQVSEDVAADDPESDAETESWWPGLGSRWNTPSDTIELDLKSGWAALGFDTSEHGIQPVATFEPTTTPQKGLGRFSGIRRRLGWGLADQAVSSLTNFAVSLYVAHSLGPTQFGAFSLAYVTYSFVLNASRGLATDPLLVRFSGAELPAWRRAVTSCTGTALATGLVAGLFMIAAAALLHGTSRVAFLAIGLTMPGLMLQDSWRYAFFALGRGSQAFLNDTIWGLVMVPGLLYLRFTHNENVFWFILVWGSAATVAAVVGPLQARVIPRLSDAWKWVSQHRDLAFRYLTVNTTNSGSAQLRAYGIGALVGLAAVGYVQAANLLMGPFLVVLMGISLVTVPEAARALRKSVRHLRLYCLVLSCAVAIAALAWSCAILVLLPRGLGHLVLRSHWEPTYPLVVPLTIAIMAQCFVDGASAGLRALGSAGRNVRAQVIQSATFVTLSLIGAAVAPAGDGALGAMAGSSVATVFAAVLWWWHLRAALREAGMNSPAPAAGRHRGPGAATSGGPVVVGSRERTEDSHAR
jgi:O-antigen/teichoic acid export membrane protein